jgi:hypothetical protein
MSQKAHLLVQCCLLLIWALILTTDNTIPVSSQTCTDPGYRWQNPLRKFWEKGSGNVTVKIDSRFANQYPDAPDAISRIEAGHKKWITR